MRVDRPEPADRRGQAVADLPFIPNGSPRLSSDHSFAEVPSTAEYRAAVDAAYRKYAIDQGCARVRELEEHVTTPAMRRIEAEDPSRHLVGFDHRLKGEDRLSEKISNAMTERARTAAEAFASVKDAIRYTFQYTEDRYATSVIRDCERLKSAGFELVERKNCWGTEQYKGINSRWREPGTGQLFEVQFHTQASFEAKQETHAAYEKLRSPGTSKAEQNDLAAYQCQISARVPIPPGAKDIQGYQ